MARKTTIAVVTGTRAEFGLLKSVMQAVADHPSLALRTIAAGLHLTKGTWRDITAAGFAIDHRVPMQQKGKSGRSADVQALSKGVRGFGKAVSQLRPDFVLVLGDRIEAFAAASAASVGGLPVAHIHGGDRAEGVADESMRHAISKMAHLHFAATAKSQRRLIRMGENAGCVFNVGSPAMDELPSVKSDCSDVGCVVMLHPIGDIDREEANHMRNVMRAVTKCARAMKDHENLVHYLFQPNADPGSDGIQQELISIVEKTKPSTRNSPQFKLVAHLPRQQFLEVLGGSRMIMGNSSAGLIEAAALKVPCVNIGPRQNGREKPSNVIDCNYGVDSIAAAIRAALKMDIRRMRHPYGDGNTGRRIAQLLADKTLNQIPIRKQNAY